MQAQQLGVCAGRLVLLFNNNLTRSNLPSSQHRTALRLQITRLHQPLQISSTVQGNITEGIAGVKLVKVKFVLQRRCEFGQQFFVVGDDEVFGAWNPKAALPMQWSEGHVWTTELEVVMGKRIEFKVILVGDEGVLEWQPGPNRVLKTMESSSPLVVLETWPEGDQGDAFLGLERNDISDIQILSAVTNVGGEELPIPVVDSKAVPENMETTDDGARQSNLETGKQIVSLPPEDSNMDMAREPSVLEKDLRWSCEFLSMLWNKLTKD